MLFKIPKSLNNPGAAFILPLKHVSFSKVLQK